MAACCKPKTAFILKVLYAITGIVIGLIVCAVFNVAFDNKPAAFLGLTSAVFAAVVLVQFIYLFVRAEVQQRPHHFAVLCLFGVMGVLGMSLGIGAFVAFLGLGIMDSIHHKDLRLPETHYIACVWAFAIFKWGLTGFLYAVKAFHRTSQTSSSRFQRLAEQTPEEDYNDTIQA